MCGVTFFRDIESLTLSINIENTIRFSLVGALYFHLCGLSVIDSLTNASANLKKKHLFDPEEILLLGTPREELPAQTYYTPKYGI